MSATVRFHTLTAPDLQRIEFLDGNTTLGGSTKLIINVTDAGSVTLPVRYWNVLMTSGIGNSVIWNFPNATSVSITQFFVGSLLAPNAAATVYDVNIGGDVVAKSLDYRPWTSTAAHYDTTIPCIG
jgi:choice-of-anchor A domain-containing protein